MSTADLLTDAEARQAIGKGALDSDLAQLLAYGNTAISKLLAGSDACGPIIYGTVTAEAHCGGKYYLYLKQHPVQGVVQVVEYDNTTAATLTAETNASKPSAAYTVNLTNGRIRRRANNADVRFPVGDDNVIVTYVAGRYTSTATVDEKFKFAASLCLKNAWRAWENSVAQLGEFDVPQSSFPKFIKVAAAKDLLGSEWRGGSGGFD